jgi:hypothetical protein
MVKLIEIHNLGFLYFLFFIIEIQNLVSARDRDLKIEEEIERQRMFS